MQIVFLWYCMTLDVCTLRRSQQCDIFQTSFLIIVGYLELQFLYREVNFERLSSQSTVETAIANRRESCTDDHDYFNKTFQHG